MIRITKKLRAFAEKNLGAKAADTEETIRSLVNKALLTKKITAQTLADLTKDDKAKAAKFLASLGKKKPAPTPTPAKGQGLMTKAQVDAIVKASVDAAFAEGAAKNASNDPLDVAGMYGKSAEKVNIRVKDAVEQYDATRKTCVFPEKSGRDGNGVPNPRAGQVASVGGIDLDHASQRDKAVIGAWFKWHINRAQRRQVMPLTEHEKNLVNYALRNYEWTGVIAKGGQDDLNVNRRKLNEVEVKTMLDDSISGGIELAPVVFDNAIITYPVLYGQLFPMVNVKNIASGRRVHSAKLSLPTFTPGTPEGTAIEPFNTASFVTAFDTAMYTAVGAMEIGKDLMADSPVDFASEIIEGYGLKALEYLDRVIAVGDGINEPLGVFNTTGYATVNSESGAGGPLTVSDFEGLMFGLPAEFQMRAGANLAYISNNVMYRRARSIKVGTTDQRRVFGMNEGNYQIFEKPFRINGSVANGRIAYADMSLYRMYRRLGLQVETDDAGKALRTANTMLIVVRMRIGGQMEQGGGVALMLDAHA